MKYTDICKLVKFGNVYEKCKDEVIKLNINPDFWLEFLKFIDANPSLYLYNSY
jgi:hypothetical protein